MNHAAIEGLLRRNAEACENARLPQCRCRCGGELHGKAHGDDWIRREAELLLAQLAQMDALAELIESATSPQMELPL
jgi:hypothetical protein